MRLIYHPAAESELIDAARFYEGRVPRLGAQFLDTVEDAALLILQAPDRWQLIEADVRRYPLPRFPYFIFYRALSDEVRISPLHTTAVIPAIGGIGSFNIDCFPPLLSQFVLRFCRSAVIPCP